MKQILMANDLSVRSERALKRALSLAVELEAELEVVTVVDEMFLEKATHDNQRLAEDTIRAQLESHAASSSARVKQKVIVGLDYEDILQRAEDIDADLIVLGPQRHEDPKLYKGSTAERVIRYGSRPALVVKDEAAHPYRQVMVATDLSTHAQAAAQTAAKLAPKANFAFVHVVIRPIAARFGLASRGATEGQDADLMDRLNRSIQQMSDGLGESAPPCEVRLRKGEVLEVVLAEIADLKPDLLTVGTHGRSGMAHALMGSVAEALLASSEVDVLAVKEN